MSKCIEKSTETTNNLVRRKQLIALISLRHPTHHSPPLSGGPSSCTYDSLCPKISKTPNITINPNLDYIKDKEKLARLIGLAKLDGRYST